MKCLLRGVCFHYIYIAFMIHITFSLYMSIYVCFHMKGAASDMMQASVVYNLVNFRLNASIPSSHFRTEPNTKVENLVRILSILCTHSAFTLSSFSYLPFSTCSSNSGNAPALVPRGVHFKKQHGPHL